MEEYIPGIDLTVGLMSGKVIGMLEVITEKEIYDYEFKYNNKNTKWSSRVLRRGKLSLRFPWVH